jgi:hypothetical protein
MRTLLRHVPTGLYVQSAEQWTGKPEEAFDFKTMGQAIRFVEKAGLSKMELAFMSSQFVPVRGSALGDAALGAFDQQALRRGRLRRHGATRFRAALEADNRIETLPEMLARSV